MSTTLAYNPKSSSYLKLYQDLKRICQAHVGVASFDSGPDTDFKGKTEYQYPLIYLEDVVLIQEGESKNVETYTINLNAIDRLPKDPTGEDRVRCADKVKQLFSELKKYMELRKEFGTVRVKPASLALFSRDTQDDCVRLHGEFSIEVPTLYTANVDPQDLLALFPSLQ